MEYVFGTLLVIAAIAFWPAMFALWFWSWTRKKERQRAAWRAYYYEGGPHPSASALPDRDHEEWRKRAYAQQLLNQQILNQQNRG